VLTYDWTKNGGQVKSSPQKSSITLATFPTANAATTSQRRGNLFTGHLKMTSPVSAFIRTYTRLSSQKTERQFIKQHSM
jgi:hypothetical protein